MNKGLATLLLAIIAVAIWALMGGVSGSTSPEVNSSNNDSTPNSLQSKSTPASKTTSPRPDVTGGQQQNMAPANSLPDPSQNIEIPENQGFSNKDGELPEEMKQQLNSPPPELPEDLKRQLNAPPPELPDDLKAQLNSPPPPLPEDIKKALETPPRIVGIDEVNTPQDNR